MDSELKHCSGIKIIGSGPHGCPIYQRRTSGRTMREGFFFTSPSILEQPLQEASNKLQTPPQTPVYPGNVCKVLWHFVKPAQATILEFLVDLGTL